MNHLSALISPHCWRDGTAVQVVDQTEEEGNHLGRKRVCSARDGRWYMMTSLRTPKFLAKLSPLEIVYLVSPFLMRLRSSLCSLRRRIGRSEPGRIPVLNAGCCGALIAVSFIPGVFAAEISGEWELAINYMGDTNYSRLILKVEAGKLFGTLMNVLPVEGTVTNGSLSFTAKRSNGALYADFAGSARGDTLDGIGHWQRERKMTWSAKRTLPPPATPQLRDFEPTVFYRSFSDAIPPSLRIFPGDTVRTWTVDAGGFDSKGVQHCLGGNPETGPFYVEGAMPGDTLAVTLKRLRLDRDTAQSGNQMANTAVTPDYVEHTKYEDKFESTWALDVEHGVARLKEPSTHLTNYTVKLQPMLGCVAVAPPGHQSFRTGWLGYYGGNMDCNQIREGTTVFLPVSVPGALLFIGDGHAAQGDGELTGDALETSEHVEFTVNVIRGEPGVGPHAENDDYVMFFGIANSYPEAVQSATTGLARWLEREYKLGPNEIAMVLGTAIQYNIAELVDPQIHVLARIRKEALSGLK